MLNTTNEPNPGEVGASLSEHLAAQEPQEWPAKLLRQDVPAYTNPEDYIGKHYRYTALDEFPVIEVKEARGFGAMADVRVEGLTFGAWWSLADFRAKLNAGELVAVEAPTLAEEVFPELCEEPGADPVSDATPAEIAAEMAPPPQPGYSEIPAAQVEINERGKRTRKGKQEPEQPAEAPPMTLDDLARCIELERQAIAESEANIQRMQAKALEMVGPLFARMGIDAGRVSA